MIDNKLDPLIKSIPIDAVASAGVKVLHDYLNEHGLTMQNPRGDTWTAKGDYNLHTSPATQAKAKEAVTLAKTQLLDVLAGKAPTGDVLEIVPSHAIVPGNPKPVPLGGQVSKALLPVLESRLLASHDLYGLLQKAKAVNDKVITPAKEKKVADIAEQQKGERKKAHGSDAETLIEDRTSWIGNLDEAGLARDLLGKSDSFVQATLDALGSSDRDDVAVEMMNAIPKTTGEPRLKKMGTSLLLRLQAELLTGSVGADEREQAYRIGALLRRVADPTADQTKTGHNNKTRPGDFDSMDAMVAIATATGDAGDAVEEVDALTPERIMDRTQSRANELIDSCSNPIMLDEAKLGASLKNERADVVIETIDQLQPCFQDDDVSFEYMKRIPKSANESALKAIDHRILRRMRRALRAGSSSGKEEAQAKRIDNVLGAL